MDYDRSKSYQVYRSSGMGNYRGLIAFTARADETLACYRKANCGGTIPKSASRKILVEDVGS